jgi:hypothetical protein
VGKSKGGGVKETHALNPDEERKSIHHHPRILQGRCVGQLRSRYWISKPIYRYLARILRNILPTRRRIPSTRRDTSSDSEGVTLRPIHAQTSYNHLFLLDHTKRPRSATTPFKLRYPCCRPDRLAFGYIHIGPSPHPSFPRSSSNPLQLIYQRLVVTLSIPTLLLQPSLPHVGVCSTRCASNDARSIVHQLLSQSRRTFRCRLHLLPVDSTALDLQQRVYLRLTQYTSFAILYLSYPTNAFHQVQQRRPFPSCRIRARDSALSGLWSRGSSPTCGRDGSTGQGKGGYEYG